MKRFIVCISICLGQLAYASSVVPAEPERPIRGMLIMLDDSEERLQAISSDLMSAIIQEAGPILASASLMVNIRGDKIEPYLRDRSILFDQLAELDLLVERTEKQYAAQPTIELLNALNKVQEERDNYIRKMILSLGAFDSKAASNWIIKEVDPALYLLLPHRYLKQIGADIAAVKIYAPQEPLTKVEQLLGLKVNHLPTREVNAVKRPQRAPRHASYFLDSLPRVFVTSGEYPIAQKKMVPHWSVYLTGHGSAEGTIADLTLPQFQGFLSFLDIMIATRILVYNSCYAAGLNTQLLYADAESGVTKTYSFPIITQALVDAPTSVPLPTIMSKQNMRTGEVEIMLNSRLGYNQFMQMITRPGAFNYYEIMAPLLGRSEKKQELKNLPQIKLPGLPWFSVIDSQNKTVSIGAVMAKTRTAPLNVATFYKHRGIPAEPLGVLLYAHDIPFEIVVNTKQMPSMVSMIPGDAVHYLHKISSSKHNAASILNSFNFEMHGPDKIFIIDSIQAAPIKSAKGSFDTITQVVIDITAKDFRSYFTYKGLVYRNPGQLATVADEKNYRDILRKFGKKATEIKARAEHKGIERKTVQEQLTPAAVAKIQQALKVRGVQDQKKKEAQENKLSASRHKILIDSIIELKNVAVQNKLNQHTIDIIKHVLSIIQEQPYSKLVLELISELLSEIDQSTKIKYEQQSTTMNFLLQPIMATLDQEIKRFQS